MGRDGGAFLGNRGAFKCQLTAFFGADTQASAPPAVGRERPGEYFGETAPEAAKSARKIRSWNSRLR